MSTVISASRQWGGRRIFLATLTALSVIAFFALLYRFYMVVFLFFIAYSLAVVVDPLVTWLQRRGIRREFSLILLYALLALVVIALIWTLTPVLIDQGRAVLEDIPTLYSALQENLRNQPIGLLRGVGRALPSDLAVPDFAAILRVSGETPDTAPFATTESAVRVVFAALSVFLMAYFWTLEGDWIVRRLVLQTPADRRTAVRTMIVEVQGKINGYFRGQVVLCGAVGLLSTLAFFVIGIPNAFLLGLLMALFEAVPVVGPILGAIPAVLMTVSTAPEKVIWVIGAILVIQVAESNLLVPRVMDRAVGVNAIVSLLAISAFGALFGFAGAVLAVPLAAILQILLTRLLFDADNLQNASTPAATPPERNQRAVLQLQARELATDARKLARASADRLPPQDETVLDEVESIARKFDLYLSSQGGQR